MSTRRQRILWRQAAWGLGLLALAQATGAVSITYLGRLLLPSAGQGFGYPVSVSADSHTGEIFVCDQRDNQVVIFNPDGLFSYLIPGGDVFRAPQDIAVDGDGLILLVATHEMGRAILELDFDGRFNRVVDIVGLPHGVEEPNIVSVALSPAGDRIFALDQANLYLWVLDREGRVEGYNDLAKGVSERERRDFTLRHVDVFGDTVVIAIPMNGEVRLFDLDGDLKNSVGIKGTRPCRLGFPVAAALDSQNELLIVDQQRMILVRWATDKNRCLYEISGAGAAPGYLYYPLDLSLDGEGKFFVSQGFEGRVQYYEGLPPAAGSQPPGSSSSVSGETSDR